MEILLATGLGSMIGESLVLLASKLWPFIFGFIVMRIIRACYIQFMNLRR